jgi:hypothetical protein
MVDTPQFLKKFLVQNLVALFLAYWIREATWLMLTYGGFFVLYSVICVIYQLFNPNTYSRSLISNIVPNILTLMLPGLFYTYTASHFMSHSYSIFSGLASLLF